MSDDFNKRTGIPLKRCFERLWSENSDTAFRGGKSNGKIKYSPQTKILQYPIYSVVTKNNVTHSIKVLTGMQIRKNAV